MGNEADSIHRQLVHKIMTERFPTREEFAFKMRNSTIKICLSLADPTVNGVKKWELFSRVDLVKDVTGTFTDGVLAMLKDKNFITRRNNTVTQSFFKLSKKDFVNVMKNNFPYYKPEIMYDNIVKVLGGGEDFPLKELLWERFITKREINQLQHNFQKRVLDKVVLKIVSIETL